MLRFSVEPDFPLRRDPQLSFERSKSKQSNRLVILITKLLEGEDTALPLKTRLDFDLYAREQTVMVRCDRRLDTHARS